MTNEHNESKLVNKLEVKFTDYAIHNYNSSFEFKDDEGAYTKDQLTIRLLELGPTLKGLKYNY